MFLGSYVEIGDGVLLMAHYMFEASQLKKFSSRLHCVQVVLTSYFSYESLYLDIGITISFCFYLIFFFPGEDSSGQRTLRSKENWGRKWKKKVLLCPKVLCFLLLLYWEGIPLFSTILEFIGQLTWESVKLWQNISLTKSRERGREKS